MKIILGLALTLALIFVGPNSVSAHVLKTDGSIGVVLHVDPDDSPVAQTPTYFLFEFKDKNNQYSLENCVCQITLTKDSTTIFSQNLNQQFLDYTFDQAGIYQLTITGQPGFKLIYDIPVRAADPQPSHSLSQTYWIVIVSLLGFAIIYSAARIIRRKTKP